MNLITLSRGAGMVKKGRSMHSQISTPDYDHYDDLLHVFDGAFGPNRYHLGK